MADFTESQLGGMNLSEPSPSSGGGSGSMAGAGIAAGSLGDIVSIFDRTRRATSTSSVRLQQEVAENSLSAALLDRQTAIAEAYEQGQFTQAQAKTKMRSTLREFVAANPAYTKTLMDTQNAIANTFGIANIVKVGTQEEQDRMRLRTTAIDRGFISPDATGEEEQRGIDRVLISNVKTEEARVATLDHTSLMQRLDRVAKEDTITRGRLQDQIAQTRWKAELATKQLFENEFGATRENMSRIVQDTSLDKISQLQSLAKEKADLEGRVLEAGSQVDQARLQGYLSQITTVYNLMVQKVDGKMEQDILDRKIDMFQKKSAATLLEDELTQALAGASVIGIGNIFTSDPAVGQRVLNTALKGDETGVIDYNAGGDETVAKELANTLSADLIATDLPHITEEEKEGVFKNFNAYLSGISSYEGVYNDAKRFDTVLTTLASARVGKAMASNSEKLTSSASASNTLGTHFFEVVLPAIQNEIPASLGQIDIEFEGGQVVLTAPKADPEKNMSLLLGLDQREAKLSRLNHQASGIILRFIHAMSHLQGHTDYRKFWEEELRPAIYGEPTEAVQEQGTEVSQEQGVVEEVNEEDFNFEELDF